MGAFIEILFSFTNLIFILAIVGWIFLLIKKTKTIGKLFILISLICFYFFSTTFGGDSMIKPLENQYHICSLNDNFLQSFNNVVVLAGGARGKELPLISAISGSTLTRVVKAAEIYKRNPKSKIVVSGDEYTSEKMKSFLIDFGIRKKDIIIDDNSHNTFQNAANVKKILGSKRFLLVTSAFHMPRAVLTIRKMGMNPYPCPTDFRQENHYDLLDFLPRAKNLYKSNLAFHEYIGIIFYKFYVY